MSICGSQYCAVKTAELFDLRLLYILEKHCFYSLVVSTLSSICDHGFQHNSIYEEMSEASLL